MFDYIYSEPPVVLAVGSYQKRTESENKNPKNGLYATVGACIAVPVNSSIDGYSNDDQVGIDQYGFNIFSIIWRQG